MGGLPRRATFIRQEKRDGIPTLLLDSGNLFAEKPLPEASIGPTLKKARLILAAMETMGYRAAAVGELDLYLGLENLKRLAASTKIHFLSANVKNSSGEPVFEPWAIFDVGSARVGVFGLTSRQVDVGLMEHRAPNIWVDDPIKVASRVVPELKKKTDLVIALTHIGFPEDRELASAVKGIDVIVGGRSRTWLKNPREESGALITSGYFQGRAAGKLLLHLNGPAWSGRGWASGPRIDFLRKRLASEKNKGPSKPGSGQAGGFEKELAGLEKRTRYDGDMVSLSSSFMDDPKIAAMIRDYRRSLKENAGKAASGNYTENPAIRYTGSDLCMDCHRKRYAFWNKTPHSTAIQSLGRKDAQADPDCVPCHVTGYLRPTGYAPARPRKDLLSVQCEACHGMGSLHASSPDLYHMVKIPKASVCRTCHTNAHSDNFNYIRDRVSVCSENPS
ncbi:MAG TPA: hypothetical protein ENH32_04950 [Proteobacteria bacterium]|nr:trifunctional nucleotide phosphoesterase protein YfkN precursor [bacterium BMS3Abin14]HDL53303.1 hypothetical protein [Pseudomonadota bacterium]